MYQIHKFTVLVVIVLLLSACQNKSRIKPVSPQLQVDLSNNDKYQFTGKMSFSDGQDGGSGRITWRYNQGLIEAILKAPLGSKSWQVIESDSGTTLITSNGDVLSANTTAELISEELGWSIPWQPLTVWVLGRQYNNKQASLLWQDDSYTIIENGWRIQYSKLKIYPEGVMPHKMVARKGDYSIKLAVKSWQW